MTIKPISLSLVKISVFVMLIAAVVVAVNAEPPFMWGGHHGIWHEERMARHLDLDDAQRDALVNLKSTSRETMRPLIRQMAEQQQQMRSLVTAEQFDESAVRAMAKQHSETMTSLMVERARHRHQVRQMLNAEQRTAFDAHQQQRHRAGHRGGDQRSRHRRHTTED